MVYGSNSTYTFNVFCTLNINFSTSTVIHWSTQTCCIPVRKIKATGLLIRQPTEKRTTAITGSLLRGRRRTSRTKDRTKLSEEEVRDLKEQLSNQPFDEAIDED